MRVIWKFDLEIKLGEQSIVLARGSQILTLQMKDGTPKIWVLVNTREPTILRYFSTYATGYSIPVPEESKKYIGTYQLKNGEAYHVFEEFD